ncbi:MAG TPA: hypothetical protein VGA88_11260 [Burkholderiales bacterium]|jgi:hypothetical protein
MNYLELLQQLEAHLGYHQLPLNPAATAIKDLFESSPLHHDFSKRLAQSIYSGNRCRSLTDDVERAATFDAVAPLRLEALRHNRTDVDLVRTIEELCVALNTIFGDGEAAPKRSPPTESGQVIDITPFRRRRARSRA